MQNHEPIFPAQALSCGAPSHYRDWDASMAFVRVTVRHQVQWVGCLKQPSQPDAIELPEIFLIFGIEFKILC